MSKQRHNSVKGSRKSLRSEWRECHWDVYYRRVKLNLDKDGNPNDYEQTSEENDSDEF